MNQKRFPSDFVWGTATSSYQIEGAAREDGRGKSIWDRFAHTPGKVKNGDTGDIAADHYHRYPQDIAIMRDIEVKAYRFSIAWPRILPAGDGAVNEAGLAFYDRLVDGLLEAGIAPFATLYHWDMPQQIYERLGGWASCEMSDHFAHYVDVVSRRLGDRVRYWATFNEPRIFTMLGYHRGTHAPGLTDERLSVQAAHHVMLAHGKSVPILRANVPHAQVGIVYALSAVETSSDHPDVLARARIQHARTNCWFVEPVLKGCYAPELLELPEFAGLQIEPGDMEIISRPIDWVGVNYYSRTMITLDHVQGTAVAMMGGYASNQKLPGETLPRTAVGWEIYPPGLYSVLKRLNDDYAPKAIYITENGAAFEDIVSPDGRVHDEPRVEFLREHFKVAWQSIQEGIPLRGYFVWSLMDNFEWAHGYGPRFGLVYIDYVTLERRLKDSARFYQSVIATNTVPEIE